MIIACDFDGTIVTHEYPKIGKPIPFAIQTLKKLQDEDHHQIILWTVREGDLLQEAIDYCKSKGLEFYAVNSNYPEEEPEHGDQRGHEHHRRQVAREQERADVLERRDRARKPHDRKGVEEIRPHDVPKHELVLALALRLAVSLFMGERCGCLGRWRQS